MVVRNTNAGTPLIDLSREEYQGILQAQISGATGMSIAAFVKAYEEGELDEADPAVAEFSVLLRLGQDGHSSAR